MSFPWMRIALLSLIPVCVAAGQPLTLHTYVGNAYLPENEEFLYTEEYEVRMHEGEPLQARTIYRDSLGEIIAERTLDFTTNPWAPDYRFEDFRTGRLEGSVGNGEGTLRVYARASSDAPLREKTLRVPRPAVVDGGFTRFVAAHWDALMEGARLPFHFVAVGRLDWYSFEIQAESAEGDGEDSARVLVIQATNPIVRMVVPPIRAAFDAETLQMREYHGRSNIRDGDPVRLIYSALTPQEN